MDETKFERRTWEEFYDSGLLLFVNTFLQIFGWSIITEYDENGISDMYPSRIGFRGFKRKEQLKAYIKISEYMNDNAQELLIEALKEGE